MSEPLDVMTPSEFALWSRVKQEKADEIAALRAERDELRAALESIRNPDRWTPQPGKLQWIGKRNVLDYIDEVLSRHTKGATHADT